MEGATGAAHTATTAVAATDAVALAAHRIHSHSRTDRHRHRGGRRGLDVLDFDRGETRKPRCAGVGHARRFPAGRAVGSTRGRSREMTRSWLIWCLAPGIVSLIGASPVAAQSSRLESGVSHQATFDFYYETRLSPPVPPLKDFGTAILAMRPDLVGRVLLDRAKRIYFGYSARVEALKDANTYRVTF